MSTINSKVDQYGFQREDDFDYETYERFMSEYLVVLARRAVKWDKVIDPEHRTRKSLRVKRYCRKGVPSSQRAQVWFDVSGARKRWKHGRGVYKRMLESTKNEQVIESIRTDLHRTFPENVHFGDDLSSKKEALFNVLSSYAHYNPTVGYCQGFNYIVALLLLVVKQEEHVFWLLDVLVTKKLPDYYGYQMQGLRVEQAVLEELLGWKNPALAEHMKRNGVDIAIPCTKWFICLYTDVLPTETVLRIWDCLFYEGSKVLLRVALTLLLMNEQKLLACKDFVALCEGFKNITKGSETIDCHNFMEKCFSLPGSLPQRKIDKLRSKKQETLTTTAGASSS
ncbi:growth hormone-regulated TBC protein 1-A-like [Dendronephthya gigantea]|uniref:growth hormone-regulated TBC protein 1-A-like n=1 Tax=Dendronephthya gigantea TaxID=151771 RepID=UPI00106BCF1F|nr:growth hormone-regulated TBC protein 1-A-like [Dendronephthya gigantea]